MRAQLRCTYLLLVAALLWATAGASPAHAQDAPPITVSSSSARYSFGQQATFSIEASAAAEITAVSLYVKLQGETNTEVHPLAFEPRSTIQASIERNLRLFPLPPFGQVTWWWEIRDGAGNVLETEPASFQYVDNRFEWHTASDEPIWVHTQVDDPVYTQSALDTAKTALEQIGRELEAPSLERVDIYLYLSEDDIKAALQMAGREWVGGQARPELSVILAAIPHNDGSPTRMERDIPHELTHHLIYHTVGSEGYQNVPAWLDEGLATANELQPDPTLEAALETAHAEGRLIPLTDLCAPSPADTDVAFLFYAQSGSLVRYIRHRYGSTGIRSLLAAYADGAGCEGGIIRALDTTPQRLNLAWRAQLIGLSGWLTWLTENKSWLFLWGLSLLLALPMARGLRTRNRDIEQAK